VDNKNIKTPSYAEFGSSISYDKSKLPSPYPRMINRYFTLEVYYIKAADFDTFNSSASFA